MVRIKIRIIPNLSLSGNLGYLLPEGWQIFQFSFSFLHHNSPFFFSFLLPSSSLAHTSNFVVSHNFLLRRPWNFLPCRCWFSSYSSEFPNYAGSTFPLPNLRCLHHRSHPHRHRICLSLNPEVRRSSSIFSSTQKGILQFLAFLCVCSHFVLCFIFRG